MAFAFQFLNEQSFFRNKNCAFFRFLTFVPEIYREQEHDREHIYFRNS